MNLWPFDHNVASVIADVTPPPPPSTSLIYSQQDVADRTLPNLYPLRLAKSILIQKLPSRFSCHSALRPESDIH